MNCEAAIFSENPHQANLQLHLFLFYSFLRFNFTLTFLAIAFDCTYFFSPHISLLETKFFLLSRPFAVYLLPHGAPLRSPFYKNFLRPVFTYCMLYLDGFLFFVLSSWNAFTEWPVVPLLPAFFLLLYHFFSLRHPNLPYESL